MSRSNLCFKLCLLERGVQVTTSDFGFMDNLINLINLIALYLAHSLLQIYFVINMTNEILVKLNILLLKSLVFKNKFKFHLVFW
jgi:hypothetical protein